MQGRWRLKGVNVKWPSAVSHQPSAVSPRIIGHLMGGSADAGSGRKNRPAQPPATQCVANCCFMWLMADGWWKCRCRLRQEKPAGSATSHSMRGQLLLPVADG
jgi:hypothetical protein